MLFSTFRLYLAFLVICCGSFNEHAYTIMYNLKHVIVIENAGWIETLVLTWIYGGLCKQCLMGSNRISSPPLLGHELIYSCWANIGKLLIFQKEEESVSFPSNALNMMPTKDFHRFQSFQKKNIALRNMYFNF